MKILAVCDYPGWAFENVARAVAGKLPEHEIDIVNLENFTDKIGEEYDLIWCLSIPVYVDKIMKHFEGVPYTITLTNGNEVQRGRMEKTMPYLKDPNCYAAVCKCKSAYDMTTRPKILCHVNRLNWCLHTTAESIMRRLSDEFDFELIVGSTGEPKSYDLLWAQGPMTYLKSKNIENWVEKLNANGRFIFTLSTGNENLMKILELNTVLPYRPAGIKAENHFGEQKAIAIWGE